MGEEVKEVKVLEVEVAIFCHKCCRSGWKFLKGWVTEHPLVKIESNSMLVVRDKGYDKKYGFELEDLNKWVYLVYRGEVIKGEA